MMWKGQVQAITSPQNDLLCVLDVTIKMNVYKATSQERAVQPFGVPMLLGTQARPHPKAPERVLPTTRTPGEVSGGEARRQVLGNAAAPATQAVSGWGGAEEGPCGDTARKDRGRVTDL